MAIYTYKVETGDDLHIGSATSPRAIFKSAGAINILSSEKVVTTGSSDVVDPDISVSLVETGGAHTVTLANGTYTGQTKKIILQVDGGNMTLTPASFTEGTSLTFADAMDCVELIWSGTAWGMAMAAGVAIV